MQHIWGVCLAHPTHLETTDKTNFVNFDPIWDHPNYLSTPIPCGPQCFSDFLKIDLLEGEIYITLAKGV